jgi:hypothetical protein
MGSWQTEKPLHAEPPEKAAAVKIACPTHVDYFMAIQVS